MKTEIPKICRFCKWYRIEEDVTLPHSYTGEKTSWTNPTINQKRFAFCCYNPPSGGIYPFSFGETISCATCSKWEMSENAPQEAAEGEEW